MGSGGGVARRLAAWPRRPAATLCSVAHARPLHRECLSRDVVNSTGAPLRKSPLLVECGAPEVLAERNDRAVDVSGTAAEASHPRSVDAEKPSDVSLACVGASLEEGLGDLVAHGPTCIVFRDRRQVSKTETLVMPVGTAPSAAMTKKKSPPGLEIRRRRDALDWSIRDLADRAGVDKGVIERLEAGAQGSPGRSNSLPRPWVARSTTSSTQISLMKSPMTTPWIDPERG